MILLVLGIAGIAYALVHAATGDDRCAERCSQEGYADSRYTAPLNGAKQKCECVREDAGTVLMR